ncbi:cell cycle control protein 50C isoform X1 [Peromyscus eremicus]|uniref:cell cycle control protein 50C isoform X1 n=1 Tax=Peromyscus eremicus TaxID=42410 RepID=UPI0027DD32EB|nr:cell cycle control protein 50C isoform X1 [Peromyscus eremicus]XP_059132834.1 cell cycle control protein 50C isoform X1 [Peromyscus eremicus]
MEMMPQYDLSRMPENTALKQQTLPAHQLDLSASVVLSIFFATGGFCLCMGIILLLSAKSTREIEGDVYMYYKLYGFYQNLYRYILSRSNSQLVGKDIWDVKNCSPFQLSHNGTPIIPCGAVANSMFNDTITLSYNLNSSINIEVPMLKSGLTWWTDKYVKFRNPRAGDLASAFAGSAKPPHWAKPIYELDTDDPGNNGFINEDLIVWMRTAAFPTFKKLYRRLNRVHNFVDGLPAGNYSFNISYNFPVTVFQGEKSVVLSTLTWIGGGGLFLGLTYTVTGALTLLASFAILAIYLMLKRNRKCFL